MVTKSRQPNERLREVIAETGIGYEAVARAVRRIAAENGEVLSTNKSAVAHWVAGTEPADRTAAYLAEALSRRCGRQVTRTQLGLREADSPTLAGSEPIGTAIVLGRADLEHRHHLAAAAYTAVDIALPIGYDHEPVARMLAARTGSNRVGDAEISIVHSITSVFCAADEQLGGGHGLSTIAAYLAKTAAPMLTGRFANESSRQRAFGSVSELAWLLGWKHHDLGHEGAAQKYYVLGFQLAVEADPHAHAAWMMRAIAQQALSMKQPKHCADLIDAALGRGRMYLDGASEALLHITQARAHAATGNGPHAARALLDAEYALARDGGEPQPSFSALDGPAGGTVDSHTARTLTAIGDHAGTEARHRAAFSSWDPVQFPRVHMLTHADLGDCLAAQARADEAVASWNTALDLAEGMSSGRGAAAMTSILPTLAYYRRRGVPGASTLDRRIPEADV
jgi:hypothetical protein